MSNENCPCDYGICDECEANGSFKPKEEKEEPENWQEKFLEKFLKTY